MSNAILGALRDLLPGEAIRPGWAPASWPEGTPPPAAVLAPTSEAQMAGVLERASREGWTVMPAGLCTWLGGNGTPEVDLVLSTRNLRDLESYEPADLTLTAAAGTPWRDLRQMTGENGQWVPLDPPGSETGSLGAVVATGVAGPLRHAFGAPRDHVLGVTMVSGDGRILRWGGRVVKNVAGFDITRLSIGSWGALGVITSVSARLFPLPAADTTLLLRAPTAEDLLPIARAMGLSPLPFSAVELLEPLEGAWLGEGGGNGMGVGLSRAGGVVEPGASGRAALALRILGSEVQAREVEGRAVGDLSGESMSAAEGILTLRGPESAAFHEALGAWEAAAALVLRMSLLPSLLEALLGEARELAARFGAMGLAAHVGWGTLRVGFPRIPTEGEEARELVRTLRELRNRLEAAKGSLVLSQGPSELLREVGAQGGCGPEERLMRGLKEEFDPAGILSPGRFGL
ncbi:MAG: FAD-binding oxidoreductase [Longimicrobiales bacterium]